MRVRKISAGAPDSAQAATSLAARYLAVAHEEELERLLLVKPGRRVRRQASVPGQERGAANRLAGRTRADPRCEALVFPVRPGESP